MMVTVVVAAVAVVVTAAVVVVMAVVSVMAATVYVPLVDTLMILMKSMNVAGIVVLRLSGTYDLGRYVLLVLTVPGGTKK